MLLGGPQEATGEERMVEHVKFHNTAVLVPPMRKTGGRENTVYFLSKQGLGD